jgi:tetratricopeptide (TPR) repeat protein
MRSFSFSLDVPAVLDTLAPDLRAAMELYPAARLPAERLTRQVTEWARGVYSLPPQESLRSVLKEQYDQVDALSVPPAAAVIACLHAQYHFQREEAAEARHWNDAARRQLGSDGLPPLAHAALRAQGVSIEIQGGNLDRAITLDEEIRELHLSEPDHKLLFLPQAHVRLERVRAEGSVDLAVIPPELPSWDKEFQRGRLLLQSARYRTALEAFQRAIDQVGPSEPRGAILRLHVARAKLGLAALDRALVLFREARKTFENLPLQKARLSADQGIAEVLRLKGNPGEARGILEQAIEEAKQWSLRKEVFRALLSLAALTVGSRDYARARSYLEEARGVLSSRDQKDLCSWRRQMAELEFKAGRRQFALENQGGAERLIAAGAADELAILRADLGVEEAWSLVRDGEVDAAREHVARYVRQTKEAEALAGYGYRDEVFPRLNLFKLLWLGGYLELRQGRPEAALAACAEARRIAGEDLGDRGDQSRLRCAFLEALAYAKLGDFAASCSALEEVQAIGEQLGFQRPILGAFELIKRWDRPEAGNKLAFEVYCGFRKSREYERFQRFEGDFALAVDPVAPVRISERAEPLSEEGWREADEFLQGYMRLLQAGVQVQDEPAAVVDVLDRFADFSQARSVREEIERRAREAGGSGGPDWVQLWSHAIDEIREASRGKEAGDEGASGSGDDGVVLRAFPYRSA